MLAAAATSAAASGPPTLKGSSGPLTVTLSPTPPAKPKVNVKYTFTVTATLSGKPAHATALYRFLVLGFVVSTQYPGTNTHAPLRFTGHYSDYLKFPPAAVGHALTFELVVAAGGRTVNLTAPITTQR